MNIDHLDKTIAKFWYNHGRSSIYHLGKCADFAYALQKFLKGGELTMIGGFFHVVLKYKGYYCDIKGCHTFSDLMCSSPIALNSNGVKPANAFEINHIKSLLNQQFVDETVAGLKQASKEV